MDRSAELRWFFRGRPPEPIVAWFEAAAEPPQTRTDVYLVLPGTDALGVKIRGGTTNLEIKLRAGPAEALILPVAGSGQLEEWQRWSFSRPAVSRLLPRLGLPKAGWRAVRKQRRLVTMPHHDRDDAGCRVEITALEIEADHWSTVGFESFGPEPDLVPALRAAAERLFDGLEVPGGLGAELSSGYPGWLATL